MNPGQKPWTKREFDRKVSWTAEQIRSLEPDIIGLQELWNRDVMGEVLDRHALADTYELLAEPANGDRIICGALVRKGMRRGNPDRPLPRRRPAGVE